MYTFTILDFTISLITTVLDNKNYTPISRGEKEKLNQHLSFVLWLTGLPASGKTSIAIKLEQQLFSNGIRTVLLDGDATRMGINKDLDFSPSGRKENIRRVAEIAKLMNDAGVVVITSLISPFTADRILAREIIGSDCFVEIFVDAPIETCKARDPKGLYKLAAQGKINNFTGISSPYEPPQSPSIHLKTAKETERDSVSKVLEFLKGSNLLSTRD